MLMFQNAIKHNTDSFHFASVQNGMLIKADSMASMLG